MRFRPHASFFFAVICFAGMTVWYITARSQINPADLVHLAACLESEQSSRPKKPKILIAGSSLAGMGIHVDELEKAAGIPAAKIAMNAGTPLDTLGAVENYASVFGNTKILILELAPFLLGEKQAGCRKAFFANIKNSDRVFRKGEMTAFVPLVLGSRISFSDFYKAFKENKRSLFYEEIWHSEAYWMKKETEEKPALRETAAQVREKRLESGSRTYGCSAKESSILESQQTALFRLLDLCREHGIFTVTIVTPKWYGQSDFTQSSLHEKTDNPYLCVLQDIDKRPDCAVIIARDFTEITSEGSDEDYLFDYGHMTEEGAKVYTNWLVDRLMEMPKTAEAVRNRTTIIR